MTTSQPTSPAQPNRMASAAGWGLDLLVVAAVCSVAARFGRWHWPLTPGQLAYGAGLGTVTLAGWRWWRRRAGAARAEPVAEPMRVLLVAAAAVAVMAPMFTHLFIGGTDARWYALMLHDFIEQWRAGGPPVFLGQGEYVWNGAVHPFRSAPVYMHVAGLWDWLTCQSLDVVALQHLTAITAALGGAWGWYGLGVRLEPQRRWAVAAVAIMYALSAAVLTPFYNAEAYMTYMASAAFVLVFYGNAKILTEGRGWLALAAGLSLVWMSHPPTAMQVTLLTAFLQVGGLAFGRGAVGDWGRAAAGAAVFVLLSAYYFTGMSEIPRGLGGDMKIELVQVGGLLAGWLAVARFVLMKGRWPWALLLVGALGVLGFTCPPWAGWLALLAALLAGCRWLATKGGRFEPAGYEVLLMLGGILLTAVIMDAMLRSGPAAKPGYPTASAEWAAAWSAIRFDPLLPLRKAETTFDPGLGLWLGGVLAGVVAFRRRDPATQLFFGAIVLMCPLVLHLPRAGDFLVEYIPLQLRIMTAAPMHLRTMPVLTALLAAAAVLAVRAVHPSGRTSRWLTGTLLGLLVAWYAWQARVFVQRGFQTTSPAERSAQNWRTENAPMDRFVYDLLPMPRYFSHGKMVPWLEVRLLTDDGRLIYGPAQMVEAMEAAGNEVSRLQAEAIKGNPDWLQLEPRFTLRPGEHRVLRFEFDPARTYSGYLLFFSEHGYREYHLPDSGMERAFGTGAQHSRVISLWNSGAEPEHYQLQFQLKPGHDLKPGQYFATVTMTPFRPGKALIQVESLNPWRARTNLPWSGQLETPRVYLPGYEVTVDGRRLGPQRLGASPDHLLQIAMPPGEHTVEVRFAGTGKLWAAGAISLAAWLTVLAVALTGARWKPLARLNF